MKKIIISIFALAFAVSLFGQRPFSKKSALTSSDYLKRNQWQKKTGLFLLGSGVTMMVIGAIIPEGEPIHVNNWISGREWASKNDGIKGNFISAGVLSMLGSIPLFIVSGKNKRRADAVSALLKTENASMVRGFNLNRIKYPVLAIKIVLN